MSVNIAQQDLYFEEELGRNPYYLKIWWNYLQYKLEAKPVERFVIYERALRCLPRSFKLWKFYLSERSNHLASKSVTDRKYDMLIETYERAIVHMHKMPQIW